MILKGNLVGAAGFEPTTTTPPARYGQKPRPLISMKNSDFGAYINLYYLSIP